MNVKNRAVELRTSKHTADGALQKGEDFVKVCLSLLGAFNIQVAIEQSTN
jgi:hypothetical protein